MTNVTAGMNRDFGGILRSQFDKSQYYFIPIAGMGVKTSTPFYEDFDSRTLGAATSPIGDLIISNVADRAITVNSHSGANSLECAYTGGISAPGRFPKAYITLKRSNKVYFCCWFKFAGTTTGVGNVWKFLRFNNTTGVDPYGDSNKFSHEMTSLSGVANPVSQSSTIVVDGSITTSAANQDAPDDTPANLFQNGQWIFYEGFIDVGTVGNNDANLTIKANNKVTLKFSNRNFLSATNSLGIKFVLTPMNGIDDFTSSTLISNMDEIYCDGSLARCIMTDNSNYDLSTQNTRCVQVLNYSNSSGSYLTRKRGLFTSGASAYYHFWNTSGVYVGYVLGTVI